MISKQRQFGGSEMSASNTLTPVPERLGIQAQNMSLCLPRSWHLLDTSTSSLCLPSSVSCTFFGRLSFEFVKFVLSDYNWHTLLWGHCCCWTFCDNLPILIQTSYCSCAELSSPAFNLSISFFIAGEIRHVVIAFVWCKGWLNNNVLLYLFDLLLFS